MTRKNRGSTRNSAQFSQTECGVQVRSVRKKEEKNIRTILKTIWKAKIQLEILVN